MTGVFKSSAVIAEVRKIAAEQPEFNYVETYGEWNEHRGEKVANCVYFSDTEDVDDSTGMCLIGCALENLGVSAAEFWNHEELNNRPVSQLTDFIEFEHELDERWLRNAQLEQDCRKTWGKAVQLADARQKVALAQ